MSVNLISLASQYLTPEILAKISSMLGVDRSVIGKACSAAIPALFGQFASLASAPDGARRLYDAVSQQNTSILGNLSHAIGGPAQGAAEGGLSSLRSLLGGSSFSTLAGALGRFAGFPQSSASSLLGMLAPIPLAILGKQATEQGLNPSGLTDLLATQKDHIAAAMPSGFRDMLQQSGVDQGARIFPRPSGFDAGRVQPSSRNAWAWVILPLIAAGLIGWWLIGNRAPNVAEQPKREKAQIQETAAVGGVDLKSSAQRTLDNVSTTLKDIKDEISAKSALPKLESEGSELDNVIRLSGQLPDAGKKAVAGVVSAAQPATTQLFDKVLAIPGVKEVAKPQIDSLRAKLNTLSKEQARL
jgi:Bacterial protein of unknown function (DUF937)